jgi:uncharacterized membrane protein YesL
MNIFRTFWKSVKDLFDELFALGLANILWLIINAPVFIVALVFASNLIALLLILLIGVVTIGPATAGLYTIAERVADGRTSSWRHFFQGMREYAKLSWKVYGLWMFGLVLILFNLLFYNRTGNTIGSLISVLFIYAGLVWLGLLIYIGPLMLLQTDKRVRTIARNAALMTFGRPVFTAVTLILMLIVVVVSYILRILPLIITFAFLALWGFRATATLIAEAEARRAAGEQTATQQPATKGRGGQIRPRE